MANFSDVRHALDRTLGEVSAGNHGAFWRGKTRDEFISLVVMGLPIIELGNPVDSNLIRALKGLPPFGAEAAKSDAAAFIPRMPVGENIGSTADIELIEKWIAEGCPDYNVDEFSTRDGYASVDDGVHVRYWREIDFFFLPSLSGPESKLHVGRLHTPAYRAWRSFYLLGESSDVWTNYVANPQVTESFRYIRLHQTRIITDFYGASQDALFDSLWKFGGDLLPRDPQSGAFPEHRMNGVMDWFFWVPYIEMSLRAQDASDADVRLARAWQVGIAADGLLRKDPDRPKRMPIPEFSENDPNLKNAVFSAYQDSPVGELLTTMLSRARAFQMHGLALLK